MTFARQTMDTRAIVDLCIMTPVIHFHLRGRRGLEPDGGEITKQKASWSLLKD